jgi:hypothetical protein
MSSAEPVFLPVPSDASEETEAQTVPDGRRVGQKQGSASGISHPWFAWLASTGYAAPGQQTGLNLSRPGPGPLSVWHARDGSPDG